MEILRWKWPAAANLLCIAEGLILPRKLQSPSSIFVRHSSVHPSRPCPLRPGDNDLSQPAEHSRNLMLTILLA
jgi:hypothetical protein